MLVYIIDGFNLIHKVNSLKRSSRPHSDLIHFIKNKKLTGSRNNKVIIVFDGKPCHEAKMIAPEFEILFSHQIKADAIIKTKLARLNNKSEVIAVSDDREIKDAARKEGARVCRICDFIKAKTKVKEEIKGKDISYSLQQEITEELRKIWLKNG